MDWDAPGALSIVVQGPLQRSNAVEVANHCRHWRALFPKAEIILSLSVTGLLDPDAPGGTVDGRDGLLRQLRPVAESRADGEAQAALDAIAASCTKVALAEAALPLPPIKADSPKPNNMNLQIAAARRGLELATGEYVLRVRSDLVFLDRSFLDQYAEAQAVPRGRAAAFGQRVLISSLFTLNPFTLERLPLHLSDWFHFGLTRDVRRIWQAPPVSLADGTYYRTHRHAPGSNVAERLFNTRLAVEQHIVFHCFKEVFPELVLRYHNDRSSVDLAMDILLDNFSLCDLAQAHCVFDKYAKDLTDHAKRYHCLTREDWTVMAAAREVDYRTTLKHKIAMAGGDAQAGAQVFGANRLTPKEGRLVNGEIVAFATDGVVFYGPYAALGPGRYRATVNATTLDGAGTVTLRVTAGAGDELLAEKRFNAGTEPAPALDVEFAVTVPKVTKLEVVCSIEGIRGIAVSDVTITPLLPERAPQRKLLAPRWVAMRGA